MSDEVNDTSPGMQAAEGKNPEGTRVLEDALTEMARAFKAVNFYPRSHPTLSSAMDKAHKALVAAIGGQEQLALGISRDGFHWGSHHLAPGNQVLAGLAREFFLRQIKRVFFLKNVPVSEMENFLRILAMEEELFRGRGKAEDYLKEAGISYIWANELRLGQQQGYLPQKERESHTEVEDLDDKLTKLIEALKTESDPEKFTALSREAALTARRLLDEGKPEPAFLIFTALWEAKKEGSSRSARIKESAGAAFNELCMPGMIEFILRQLTLLDGPRKEIVLNIALDIGEDLFTAILEKIATNEALYSHRSLIQVLLGVPERTRAHVESHLEDERWWVARKMAFILGEMKSPDSVPVLMKAAQHPDIRVKKEAMKALAKIGSPEGMQKLVEIADSKGHPEIGIHAIRLLGKAGEQGAVPALIRILKNRGAMLDNFELLEETVRSLGQIGAVEAVPVLREILLKRNILARNKSVNLGLEAAESLGLIGGKEAIDALKKGAESSQQQIRLTCLKSLKTREKNHRAGTEKESGGE